MEKVVLHYVLMPESEIVIDFDLKNGSGIHLHYQTTNQEVEEFMKKDFLKGEN